MPADNKDKRHKEFEAKVLALQEEFKITLTAQLDYRVGAIIPVIVLVDTKKNVKSK